MITITLTSRLADRRATPARLLRMTFLRLLTTACYCLVLLATSTIAIGVITVTAIVGTLALLPHTNTAFGIASATPTNTIAMGTAAAAATPTANIFFLLFTTDTTTCHY